MTAGGRMMAAAAFAMAGVAGCGGQLPGDGTAPPQPLGIDGEGLPVMAALPQASASCTISSPPSRVVETATWDAPTRTFSKGALYWKLDERGRTVEHGQADGAWRQLVTRDEHGVLTTFAYELNGAPIADNSWHQVNSYDAAGRLADSAVFFWSGVRQATYAYQYDGSGNLVSVTSKAQDGEQAVESWTKFYWSGGRLITRERGSGSLVSSRDTRYYTEANEGRRLGRIHLIGGDLAPDVDGYIDLERTWWYDADGRLIRHEDQTPEATDPPVIDGPPDSVATFDPSCAAIAVLPRELYQLESWVQLP